MAEHSRRALLRGAAITAGITIAAPATALAAPPASETGVCAPPLGPVYIGPSDPRYEELSLRGYNRRYIGKPDQYHVVGSADQVARIVQDAVRAGKRIAVRSGGHCFENFVDDSAVRVVIDMSGMTGVYFDPLRGAFAVEAGATLGEVYRRLYLGWGVTIPAGYCPKVGAGGHVAGGGYGPLSRQFGLVADYLYAVEVVVVDAAGTAHAVVATREPNDPNRDLWWAHTGAGGGNFGVVTRYWFRAPGMSASDPAKLLPAPPARTLTFRASWPWNGMDERAFTKLVQNFGTWSERNAAPGLPASRLYSELYLYRPEMGSSSMVGQVSGPDAEKILDEHLASLNQDVGVNITRTQEWQPWLTQAMVGPGDAPKLRIKIKSAYLRKRFTDRQIATAYKHLTRTDYANPVAALGMHTFGGQINAVTTPGATVAAQRDSVIKLSYLVAWPNPAEDAKHVAWIREFYRDMYAETGGVPVSGPVNDGAYINYPDSDLADPAFNTSGVPWSTLYFKDNYAKLRQIKARWDPRDVFRHALSVRA